MKQLRSQKKPVRARISYEQEEEPGEEGIGLTQEDLGRARAMRGRDPAGSQGVRRRRGTRALVFNMKPATSRGTEAPYYSPGSLLL